MDTVASPDDVETALGRSLNEAEFVQCKWWLGGIEMHIVSRLGAVAQLDEDAVRYVEAEAVANKLRRNGQQESSISVSVDDATVTRRYENGVTESDIGDDLWALITPKSTVSAFTMRTGGPREFGAVYARPWWNWL